MPISKCKLNIDDLRSLDAAGTDALGYMKNDDQAKMHKVIKFDELD